MFRYILCAAFLAMTWAECPSFGDFMPWTDQCLFFPLANITKGIEQACQTTFKKTKAGTGIPMPDGFEFPQKCGHCSFKARCRKRDKQEGCYSLDVEKQTCDEFGDICSIQKHPRLGCRYHLILAAVKNCLNRPDLPDWRRDAIRRFAKGIPEGNCIEKDGQCKCCCHPYTPSDDGTTCVKQEERQCEAFGQFNEWSQCLWYPLKNVAKGIKEHCKLPAKYEVPESILAAEPKIKIPEKCGFCSFRARCRSREKNDGCFHMDVEKKACGTEDCPTCGDVCTSEKINGTCDYSNLSKGLMTKVDSYVGNLPYWRRRGIYDLARHIPYSKCKEVDGQCKCCCYPYEVSADGTKCELAAMCSFEPTH